MVVHLMRARGREHPRSASRSLRFSIIRNQDPGAGPACGPCCLQDPVRSHPRPDSPGKAPCIAVVPYLDAVATGVLYTRMLSEDRSW